MVAAGPRRRKIIGHRRRVEDEGEDEAGLDAVDIDDDSMTEGSIGSDDHDAGDDSDTSNVDEASPTSPNARKSAANGAAKHVQRQQTQNVPDNNNAAEAAVTEAEIMLNGLSVADGTDPPREINFDDVHDGPAKNSAPIIVSSSSATQQAPVHDRRRREHEEYRRKRDEDPAFVPNRGAFFMHDHRHAGPAANGFRPFARGGRGRGRGGIGGPFAPINQMHNFGDPTTNAPWAHDMHESVAEPVPHRPTRHIPDDEGPPNGNGVIPTAAMSKSAINRAMSTEKHLGNATIRVFIPLMQSAATFTGVPLTQYTKLPDHRPPLRRDKPVRVSLPYHDPPVMPRYIFPANDRSFIFIPRALRPNQQRLRGKGPRSTLGSMGGFSRRTSVFGGSYYGSVYSPSIALSRRSSIAPDVGREFIISPTGSTISRPPLPMETSRPVVRLPQMGPPPPIMPMQMLPPDISSGPERTAMESSISDLPPPQTHPLPQKPTFQENRQTNIPMHQPRPQKAVSVENIESPVQQVHHNPQPYQQAFHQQVPPQVSNGFIPDSHTRNPSYQSQHSTGTPLSQIPERAIHAAPFQPNAYPQQGFYGQPYQMVQPAQGYYYPQSFGNNMAPNASAPAFVPNPQQAPHSAPYNQQGQAEAAAGPASGQPQSTQGLVAQEVNGMVYYFEPSQLPAMAPYPSFPNAQPYAPGVVGMTGMVTPSPDAFYYPQPTPGMVYYSQ